MVCSSFEGSKNKSVSRSSRSFHVDVFFVILFLVRDGIFFFNSCYRGHCTNCNESARISKNSQSKYIMVACIRKTTKL
uniref:Uncharacterized protein n=1 Tax=Megaselia scalaris TaxID=36166 RepID=T1H3F5_MEGSC